MQIDTVTIFTVSLGLFPEWQRGLRQQKQSNEQTATYNDDHKLITNSEMHTTVQIHSFLHFPNSFFIYTILV